MQSNTFNNINESNIRNSITLPIKKNNLNNINDLNVNKYSSKTNSTILNEKEKDKNEYKGSTSPYKNRLIYEKIKKKLYFNNNNNNSNSIYNNYINMKITKDNFNKNNNSFNKTFTSSNTNNFLKNKLNLNNTSVKKKKSDKKLLSHYAAKINNYNNKYNLNNDKKGISNKNTKNVDINKKRSSIPESNNKSFSINKYLMTGNKYLTLYKYKKQGNKNNFSNQLNNSVSTTNKNNYIDNDNSPCTDRLSQNSINLKNSFIKNYNKMQDNVISLYSGIQEKKDKIIKVFKESKKISSKEEAFYILSISPILRLSEQLIFSRSSKNIKKVLPIETVINNHSIFLHMKSKELMNEISLCEKRIKTPFYASKIADITLNFITSFDEQEFKDFDILETNKDIINIYYAYIKVLYILFNFNNNNNLEGKKLKINLYDKMKEKGFKHLRDYLYYIFIAKKEEINIVCKVESINNEVIINYPDLLNIHETIKICRFTAFANYLIKEIINYGNNIKDTFELKYQAQYLLEIVMGKIEKVYKERSKNQKKKEGNNKL